MEIEFGARMEGMSSLKFGVENRELLCCVSPVM
jgi:hypothetical protein